MVEVNVASLSLTIALLLLSSENPTIDLLKNQFTLVYSGILLF